MGRTEWVKSHFGTGGHDMSDCLFCKIVEGKVPCSKVYEDDEVLAFKDINPQAPIHYLFISKEHFSSLVDVKSENMVIISKIFSALTHVANKEGLSGEGYRIVINVGKNGGQIVYHLHVHLMGGRPLGGTLVPKV